MVWVLCYKNNLHWQSQHRKANKVISYHSDPVKITPLSVSKVIGAEKEILKYAQKQSLKEEFLVLRQNNKQMQDKTKQNPMKKCSSICKLDPVLENGLVRIGGRLQNASIENDTKHPIVLPRKHQVSALIINFYHRTSWCANTKPFAATSRGNSNSPAEYSPKKTTTAVVDSASQQHFLAPLDQRISTIIAAMPKVAQATQEPCSERHCATTRWKYTPQCLASWLSDWSLWEPQGWAGTLS